MMYIRTKDGTIYDLKSKEISSIEQKDCWVNIFYYDREKGQYLECDDNGGRSMDTIYKVEIIKEADTIEELCDMFVVIENVYGKIYHSINYTLCDDLRNDKDNEGIYGAIWTDKGLIYVSKMNEQGVLELI